MWNAIHQFALPAELSPALALAALVALLHFLIRRVDRPIIWRSLLFTIAAFIGLYVAGGLHHVAGWTRVGAILHEVALIGTGIGVIRIVGLFVVHVLLSRLAVHRIVEDILFGIAYVAWVLVRLRYVGMDWSGVITTSAVVTAIVAFSLQDTLGNLLSGVVLEFDETFERGDWLSIDNVSGRVEDVNWRRTTLRTRNGELVVVPNSQLIRHRFAVVRHGTADEPAQRRIVWVNVDFGSSSARVIDTVEHALSTALIQNLAPAPAPSCVLMDFERGYARYAIRYWLIDPGPDDLTDSMVRRHVVAALQREGIRLALPEESLHIYKEDEKRELRRHQREITRRLAVLRALPLFATMRDEELNTIAERLTHAPFAPGDLITRQGAVAHWLYIQASGDVEVYREDTFGKRRLLATQTAPSIFGELGLMTGEPRSATLIAKSSVDCYKLDKESFESVVLARPEVAVEISRILVERAAANRLAEDAAHQAPAVPSNGQPALLERMLRFFGLNTRP